MRIVVRLLSCSTSWLLLLEIRYMSSVIHWSLNGVIVISKLWCTTRSFIARLRSWCIFRTNRAITMPHFILWETKSTIVAPNRWDHIILAKVFFCMHWPLSFQLVPITNACYHSVCARCWNVNEWKDAIAWIHWTSVGLEISIRAIEYKEHFSKDGLFLKETFSFTMALRFPGFGDTI